MQCEKFPLFSSPLTYTKVHTIQYMSTEALNCTYYSLSAPPRTIYIYAVLKYADNQLQRTATGKGMHILKVHI